MSRLANIVLLFVATTLSGCVHRQVQIAERFDTAKREGRLEEAQGLLVEDPRVWYEAREGEGSVWKLGGGRYKVWDEEFRGRGDAGRWHVEGSAVWRVVEEWNDYYALIEREDTPRYRRTYFFDGEKIAGTMISAAYPEREPVASVSRFDEIRAWAEEHHPEEWAYLRPGGSLDPTGDRAARTRALINRWRVEVGLEPIN